ncbi:hypothetical protein R5R35_010996 [Gryllus longicercus]|uniref:Telomerase reverse transcriptase n=2 Tax=Gryllus longicercus TaxID=2509291 RepID=A0AAN9Z656_9ORTH
MACFNLDSVFFRKRGKTDWLKMFDTSNAVCIAKCIFGKEDVVPGFFDVLAELIKNHKKNYVKYLVSARKWPRARHEKPLSHKSMRSFLFAIFNFVVPIQLCGSFKNRRVVMLFLGKLPTKGRNETICIGHVLEKVDLLSVEWMYSIVEPEKKRRIFNMVLNWFVQVYICGLLENVFFVVKTTHNYKLEYYWKSTWKEVCQKAIVESVKKDKFAYVSDEDHSMWEVGGRATLHFRSTKHGVLRPLLIKSCNAQQKIVPDSLTRIVQHFLNILYCKIASETPFNNSKNFLQKWCEIYPQWKGKKVHFVKMDVKDAFGSVNHTLLRCIIKVHFRRYVNSGQLIAVKTVKFSSNKTRILFDVFDEDFCSYHHPVQYYPIELLFGIVVKSFECCEFQWRRKFYRLKCGLPQGNELSASLCNFYLNAMDQKYLREFVSESSLLIREMDDYLFITTSHEQAVKFYYFMQKGISEFNVQINAKTETSDTHHEISYLKYIINTEDLEIGYDYSKYASSDIAHWLSLNRTVKQERFIKDSTRTTCVLSDILVNAMFNRPQTVMKIIFQCAYLQASRMHAMVDRLLCGCFREGFVVKCCKMCAKVIRRKSVKRFQNPDVGTYITIRAFYERLLPFGRYREELRQLSLRMKTLQCVISDVILEIEYVIQDLMSRTSGNPLKRSDF